MDILKGKELSIDEIVELELYIEEGFWIVASSESTT
jgi:hypothetical protein